MKHTTLTMFQKKKICQEKNRRQANGEVASHNALAEWAKNQFKLDQTPSKSTMSRIVGRAPDLLTKPDEEISKKVRDKKGKNHALEMALFEWICHQQGIDVNVSGESIRQKAEKLQTMLNEKIAPEKQSTLKFSEGWLDNFRRRWGVRALRSRGKAMDEKPQSEETELQRLKQALTSYALRDIFNAKVCGLFYSFAPDKTVNFNRASDRDKVKDRVTFLPCCNADGSEKLKLMVIGKRRDPRAFNKKTGAELGFDYYAHSKAYMTSSLFYKWLEKFQSYIARTPGRKVVLLVDDCSIYRREDRMPDMPNVNVVFLPSSPVKQVQPLAVVIPALKLRYRNYHMERVSDNVDAEVGQIYKVDILTALKWFKRAWTEIPVSLIQSSWKQSGIVSSPGYTDGNIESELNADEATLTKKLERQVAELVAERFRLSTIHLLNPAGEDECTRSVTDEDLVACMVREDEGLENNEEEGEDFVEPFLSTEEQLKALAICKRIAELRGRSDCTCLSEMQTALRVEAIQQLRPESFKVA